MMLFVPVKLRETTGDHGKPRSSTRETKSLEGSPVHSIHIPLFVRQNPLSSRYNRGNDCNTKNCNKDHGYSNYDRMSTASASASTTATATTATATVTKLCSFFSRFMI
ncbi:unnamed protein product [Polarella glacialis]|uniref:Uncharacterized protein n=1 Tax=Polarella glacialis TaxID=89957 RepID=A0A813G3T0_POLGL|nr:unnamed protein product [Polarella glacialis]